jgi:hypothetical protein
MDPSTDLDPQCLNRLGGVQRTLGGLRGCIEDGKETVTRGVDLAAMVTLERGADEPMVLLHELAPTSVTQLGGYLGGADDIGE